MLLANSWESGEHAWPGVRDFANRIRSESLSYPRDVDHGPKVATAAQGGQAPTAGILGPLGPLASLGLVERSEGDASDHELYRRSGSHMQPNLARRRCDLTPSSVLPCRPMPDTRPM